MSEKMTKWGVSPTFTVLSVIYGLLTVFLSKYLDPMFKITIVPYEFLAIAGAILIIAGLPFYIHGLVTVMRAFQGGILVTKGSFGMCRHPVYAAWIVFFVPAIMLLLNTWLGLTVPFFMYLVIRMLVDKEETYLEKTFGEAYLAYKKKVPLVLPIGWLK